MRAMRALNQMLPRSGNHPVEKKERKVCGMNKVKEKVTRVKGKRILPETLNEIKEKINMNESPADIADEYGVSLQTVYQLKSKMKKDAAERLPG